METSILNDLRTRLKSGEVVAVSGEENTALLYWRRSFDGYRFFIELNGKIIASYLTFQHFINRVQRTAQRHKLDLINTEKS